MNEFMKSLTDTLGLIPTILLIAAVVIAIPFAIIWLIKLIKFIVKCCCKGRRIRRRADYFSKPLPERRSAVAAGAGDGQILIAANEAEEMEQLNREANEELARLKAEQAEQAAAAPALTPDGEPLKRMPARKTFELRLRTNKEKVKEFYSIIHNEYHSYGIRGRMGKRRENFKKKGVLYGRLTFRGRTLRLHLPLDPKAFDEEVYKQQDYSERRGFELIPFTLRLRTRRSVKQAQELIREIMEKNELTLRPRFKPTDYVPLFPDEYTDFERKGYGYLLRVSEVIEEVETWDNRFADKAKNVEIIEEEKPQRFIKAVYSLNDLAATFAAGSTIDLSVLKERDMAPQNANYFVVTEGEYLDKPLFITANEIDPNVTKMVCVTGGQTTVKVYAEDLQPAQPVGFSRKEEPAQAEAAPEQTAEAAAAAEPEQTVVESQSSAEPEQTAEAPAAGAEAAPEAGTDAQISGAETAEPEQESAAAEPEQTAVESQSAAEPAQAETNGQN